MLSMQVVSSEVARLGGLDRFPRKPESLKELGLAFRRTYGTHPELAAAVGDVLRTVDVCPKPSHIYGAGQADRKPSGVGCGKCDGTGFVTRTDRRQTLDGTRAVPVAHYCTCHPGGRR